MPPHKASEPLSFDLFGGEEEAPAPTGMAGATVVVPAKGSAAGGARSAAAEAPVAATNAVPGSTSDSAWSVTELYELVELALRGAFGGPVWVTGEVRKVTVSSNGHRYIELADPAAKVPRAGRPAQASIDVACWSRDWPSVAAELDEVGIELVAGLVVRVRGTVGVWSGASKLRFSMDLLDIEALVGGIAASRRRLLQALAREGLLEANRHLPVPVVPLRVGLVTSAGGEAYHDFVGRLEASGFCFEVHFEQCQVQGTAAAQQVARAIRCLQEFPLDLIVLVRGGGAKGDLAVFDSEEVARAIATSRLPVWTGIGHTGDLSVADEVAQRQLVTPTACGTAVVEAVETFHRGVVSRSVRLCDTARRATEQAASGLSASIGRLDGASRHQLDRSSGDLRQGATRVHSLALLATERSGSVLSRRSARLASACRSALGESGSLLGHRRELIDVYDPRRQLARGWSLTRGAGGEIIRSAAQAPVGSEIVSVLADGNLSSTVTARSGDHPIERT